jgi:hypothetical protein
MFDNPELEGLSIEDLPPNSEFVVLEQTDTASRILLIDGRTGWVQSNAIRVEEVTLEESGFEATSSPSPTPTSTGTNTPTPTITPTATATPFVPTVIPQTVADSDVRWNAMTLGTLAAILIIFVGNVFWIVRWLRQRGD